MHIHTYLDTKYEREYVFNSDPCMIYIYIYMYGEEAIHLRACIMT